MPKLPATPETREFARTHPALSIRAALDQHIQITEELREQASAWTEYARRLESQRDEARALLENALEAVKASEGAEVSSVPQQPRSWDKAIAEGDPASLAGRIKIAMVVRGIDGAQQISDLINRATPELKKLKRQTPSKWISGEVKNIELKRFITLARVLDVDPEWLADKEGHPQRMTRMSLEQYEHIRMSEDLRERANAWTEYARHLEAQRNQARALLESAIKTVRKADWASVTVAPTTRALPAKSKDEA